MQIGAIWDPAGVQDHSVWASVRITSDTHHGAGSQLHGEVVINFLAGIEQPATEALRATKSPTEGQPTCQIYKEWAIIYVSLFAS